MRITCLILLVLPLFALAQDEASQTAPPSACASEQHRQFDFWAGSWDVTQNGQAAGHNDIEIMHGGCVLAEHWTSANGGFSGSSLNAYDQATDRWHQTWVDTTGNLLELNGGLQNGSMVLQGTRPGESGEIINRITFTPNEDGSVRQHWEYSSDGETWTTAFDGHYVRVTDSE
jgi:hypothetical protein